MLLPAHAPSSPLSLGRCYKRLSILSHKSAQPTILYTLIQTKSTMCFIRCNFNVVVFLLTFWKMALFFVMTIGNATSFKSIFFAFYIHFCAFIIQQPYFPMTRQSTKPLSDLCLALSTGSTDRDSECTTKSSLAATSALASFYALPGYCLWSPSRVLLHTKQWVAFSAIFGSGTFTRTYTSLSAFIY